MLVGKHPDDKPIVDVLAHVISGHREIVAEIANHIELDQTRRDISRNQAANARVSGGSMGGGGNPASGAVGDSSTY